jgi:tetratricopeptide (TPR) repeat protein
MNLDSQLAQLENAQLIRSTADADPTFIFKNILSQQAAYQSLLAKNRRELHRRVAETYETLYAGRLDEIAPLLAGHYAQAGDDRKTFDYSIHAGDAAARVYANAEALTHYSRAMDIGREIESDDWARLYLKRGRVYELMGRIEDAQANYRDMESRAQARGDRAMELGALSALATIYATPTVAHDSAEAKRLSDAALGIAREIGDRASEAKILWNLQNIAFFTNDLRAGIVYGEQALVVAREFDLREQMAYVLNDISRIYLVIGETGKAMRAIQEAKKIWGELGNVPMLADNLATAGETSAYAGALDDAFEFSEQAVQLAQSINNSWVLAYARWTEGLVHFERGEVDRAIAAMNESFRAAEQAGFAAAKLGGASDLGLMYGLLGAFDRGIELCQQTIQRSSQFLPFLPWALAHLALVYARQGNLTQAVQAARQARDKFQRQDYFLYLTVHVGLAEGEVALGQKEYTDAINAVAPIIARYQETGIEYRVAEAFLIQARAWTAQSHFERAEALLTKARAISERMMARQTLWQILLEQSQIADARGDVAQAKMLRDQAREIVNYVSAHISDAELHGSFLNLPDVRAVMQ